MASSPSFTATPRYAAVQLTNASSTTAQTLYSAPTGGGRIDKLILTSTDTSAHDVQIWLTKSGGSAQLVGTVSVAAGAGNSSGVQAKDALADPNVALPYDAYGNRALIVEGSAVISLGAVVAVTSGKTVYATAVGGEF